jgi:PAS domain-containing protein
LLLGALPIGSITTTAAAEIVAVNPKAALLLNTSARYLVGKSLLLFFEDRDACLATLRELRQSGGAVWQSITLRPRERARKQTLAYAARLDTGTMQWFLFPDAPYREAPGRATGADR